MSELVGKKVVVHQNLSSYTGTVKAIEEGVLHLTDAHMADNPLVVKTLQGPKSCPIGEVAIQLEPGSVVRVKK